MPTIRLALALATILLGACGGLGGGRTPLAGPTAISTPTGGSSGGGIEATFEIVL